MYFYKLLVNIVPRVTDRSFSLVEEPLPVGMFFGVPVPDELLDYATQLQNATKAKPFPLGTPIEEIEPEARLGLLREVTDGVLIGDGQDMRLADAMIDSISPSNRPPWFMNPPNGASRLVLFRAGQSWVPYDDFAELNCKAQYCLEFEAVLVEVRA